MIKATYTNKFGAESEPITLEDNGNGYVLVPESGVPNTAYWRLYAPKHGFEANGPWYLWRELRPRDLKQCRRTVAISYADDDLIASLCPDETRECALCGGSHQVVAMYFGSELLCCPVARPGTIYYMAAASRDDDGILDSEFVDD